MLSDKNKEPKEWELVQAFRLDVGDKIKLESPGMEEVVIVTGIQACNPTIEDGTITYSLVEVFYTFRQESYSECVSFSKEYPTNKFGIS